MRNSMGDKGDNHGLNKGKKEFTTRALRTQRKYFVACCPACLQAGLWDKRLIMIDIAPV